MYVIKLETSELRRCGTDDGHPHVAYIQGPHAAGEALLLGAAKYLQVQMNSFSSSEGAMSPQAQSEPVELKTALTPTLPRSFTQLPSVPAL